MKNSHACKIALAIAMSSSYGLTQLPKEKTSGDLDSLSKAEEKRKRKANKRIDRL